MGRQAITEHIRQELHEHSTTNPDKTNSTDAVLCQQCGTPIESDDQCQDDYIVHRVPSHGETEMHSVFYCGPSCFQDAMTSLFDV